MLNNQDSIMSDVINEMNEINQNDVLDAKVNVVLRILSKVMFTEALDEVLNH